MAMKMGKHLYCEKPLTHCIHEAQVMADVAAEKKVVTQMGTQHHARSTPRRVVEIIRAGVIGDVRTCHVWIGGNRGGGERPTETPPVPAHLKWDLWLGPRPYRPYHPEYAPYKWRFWWDFGTGETGNNGCHIMDYAYWPLAFKHPLTVEAEGPPVHAETSPRWMHTRYTFPARGGMPPLTLHWYHTKEGPPVLKEHNLPHWGSGVLFMGTTGMLLTTYGEWKLFPESTFTDFKPPEPSIPASVGHHKEWLLACKTGGPTSCSFDYASTLTQIVLLGNVSYRTGKRLTWDPKNLRAEGCPTADPYIKEPYRKGWTL
jgi:predicted dehydrogenase